MVARPVLVRLEEVHVRDPPPVARREARPRRGWIAAELLFVGRPVVQNVPFLFRALLSKHEEYEIPAGGHKSYRTPAGVALN